MRAVGYIRVSTAAQAEKGTSLAEQEQLLRAYCAEHGYRLVELVSDDISGKISERPGIRRVRALAEAGEIELVLCAKIDRLARRSHLGQGLAHWLEARDIRVEFVEQRFDNNAAGRLTRGIFWSVAEFESELIRERTMAGRAQKAQSGRLPCGNAPYGYRMVSTAEAAVLPEFHGRDGELLIEEREAEVVRRIFTAFAAGASIRGLVMQLNEEGTTARSGRKWSHVTLRYVLANPVYGGTLYFGRRQCRQQEDVTSGGRPKVRRTARAEEECIPIPVPALVEPAIAAAARQRLEEQAGAHIGRPALDFPLRSLVFCGHCRRQDGLPLRCGCQRTSRNPQRGSYIQRRYTCRSQWSHIHDWCGTIVSALTLEKQAREEVFRLTRPGRLVALYRERQAAQQEEKAPAETLGRLQSDLQAVNTRLGRLADQMLEDLLPADVLAAKARELTAERERLRRLLHAAESRQQERRTRPDTERRLAARAEALRAQAEAAGEDPEAWAEVFQATLKGVVVQRGKLPVFRLSDALLADA